MSQPLRMDKIKETDKISVGEVPGIEQLELSYITGVY